MKSTQIYRLMLTFLVALTLPMITEADNCIEATDCFCNLVPNTCEVLIIAEVVKVEEISLSERYASIRVIGTPYYDPQGLLHDGQLLEDLGLSPRHLKWGDVGLFLVYPPGSCDPNKHFIAHFALQSEGKLLCYLDYRFPGAAVDDVVSAVFSDDCRSAVFELGVENHCGPSGAACAL